MNRFTHSSVGIISGIGVCVASAIPALGQGWITFENETATRIAAEPGFPYNPASDNPLTDTDEKDYGVGDFDNDGDADLIVVRKQPRTTQGKRKAYLFLHEDRVLVNRTGQYAPQLLDPANNRDIAVVDVDGDGWLDLVTAVTFPVDGDSASIKMPRVYMNLGADANGDWLGFLYTYVDQRIPDFPQDPFFNSVAAGDLDDDGDPDLFFADSAADSSVPDPPGGPLKNRLLLNDGDGFFTDVTQTNIIDSGASLLVGSGFGTRGRLADLDDDGDADILACDACSASPRTIRFAQNDGSAIFTVTSNLTIGHAAYDFDTGDLNQDGLLDFYETDAGSDRVFLRVGTTGGGLPTFTNAIVAGQVSSTTTGFGGNVYLRDLDSDGRLDALVCDEDIDLPQGGNRMSVFHGIASSPWLTGLGDPFVLGSSACTEPPCTRDTFDAAILDIDLNNKLDLVVGTDTGTKVFLQPPIIPPGPDVTPPAVASSDPADGTVDHLQDQTPAGEPQGISHVTIAFNEVVRDATTDGPLSPVTFSIALSTNLVGLTPPAVMDVTPGLGGAYVIDLDLPIPAGAWTTITVNVEDLAGNAIAAGAVDLGFLPGDVSGDLITNTQDLLATVAGLNTCAAAGACSTPAALAELDVNRNGVANTQDLLRVIQLLNGVSTQNPWNGVALPPQP